ncbi:MAG: hypothetical protein ACODAD_07205 [Planctomycetota bacterium]
MDECAVQAGMLQGSEWREVTDGSGGRRPRWGPPAGAAGDSSAGREGDGGAGGRDVSDAPGFVKRTVAGETPGADRDDEPEVEAFRSEAEVEAEEERRVDAILSRLHVGGLECLTPEERDVLERASARYRSRSRH